MLNHNDDLVIAQLNDRRDQLLAEAEQRRQLRLLRTPGPTRWDRLLAALGAHLVRLGTRLEQRRCPALPASLPETAYPG